MRQTVPLKPGLRALTGGCAFSLIRPPGHHAAKNQLGGFCYFNNIAIAALRLREHNKRIVIIDLDCHHGNGTQDIVLGNYGIIYLSLHQSPLYPGTGDRSERNCYNYLLPVQTSTQRYMATFEQALNVAREFKPDILAISMGFDTYKYDPLTDLLLDTHAYHRIAQLFKQIDKPLFGVLEGGYCVADLPECIDCFLSGL